MSKRKVALITGITGQDGSYLAEFLIEKNYIVHGIKRRAASINTNRLDNIYEKPQIKNKKLILHYGDLSDSLNLYQIIQKIMPDEIYNLGAQSHVSVSFEKPEYTSDINGLGTLRILESIKNIQPKKEIRFYQASSSELFGLIQEKKQSEKTPFYPRSPYAISKLYAYWITINYREAYGIYACNGILFNHESPRRGETFVTRKITIGLSEIACGVSKCLFLGNLNAKRDWGHARDYVEMQWLMLQQKKAKDYVISSGKRYSVRQFIIEAGKNLGIDIKFKGKNSSEVGYISKVNKNCSFNFNEGQIIIRVDKKYIRPAEVEVLHGNSTLARKELKWEPKITFKELVREMIEKDLKLVKEKIIIDNYRNISSSEK